MSLSGQNKALILLITEFSAQLLLWQQKKLSEIKAFQNTAADLELFQGFIHQYSKHPVIIATDLLDENFRHDAIVHVTGSDRDAVLNRKLDYAFRNTKYRIGMVTGRQKDGRRDDRILLSAVTKPEAIDTWVKVILEEKMAIQAITSIAHLLNRFIPLAKLNEIEYLLVTKLDQDNSLRQTFIRKGKVQFSRLTTISNVEEARLGTEILQETLQLRQYLERIQFIPFEQPLRIVVISSYPDSLLQITKHSTETNRFDLTDIDNLEDFSVVLEEGNPSPSHYILHKILSSEAIENVYGPAAATRYHDLKKLSGLVAIAASIVFIIGLGLNIPGLSQWLEQSSQVETFTNAVGPLRLEYAQSTERFPETPVPPREMELIVRSHESITEQLANPVDMLNMIAAALAISPGLQLSSIQWELAEKNLTPKLDPNGNIMPAPRPPQGITGENAFIGLVLQKRTQIKVTVGGQAYSPRSFRDAQEQVEEFISALSLNNGVSIFPAKMPTDVRTDIMLSTTVKDSEVRAPFILELTYDLAAADTKQVAGGASQ